MDFHSFPPNELDKLKCSFCKNYLSYFPIHLDVNNETFCGRCPTATAFQTIRNVCFETIAQNFLFPCRYQSEGCNEELSPKEVPSHEEICPCRIIPCPLSKPEACVWQGPRPNLFSHCQSVHLESFFKNYEFLIDLSLSDEITGLLQHYNTVLIFYAKFDAVSKILKFAIYNSEYELHIRMYSCQLSLKNNNKNISVDFVTTSFKDINFTELSLESISDDKNQIVDGKINIGKETKDGSLIDCEANLEMLLVLQCIVCSNYATPPIYHCIKNTGTLCPDCKDRHQLTCDACLKSNIQTRNINLDKVANFLLYPCKNQRNGCTFVSKPEKIKQHQSICELGDFKCPVDEFQTCGWTGVLANLSKHIENTHQELTSNHAQMTKKLLPQQMKCDIIKFSNRLFRLVCLKTPEGHFYFTVQVIGPTKDEFRYEIEIIDSLKRGRRLLARQVCGPLHKRNEVYKSSFCYFVKNQICHFMTDDAVITFKVNIFM